MKKDELKKVVLQSLSDGKPHKKESLIATISGLVPVDERTLRDAIAEINRDEILYPDKLIIGLSNRAGYKLVDPIEDKEEIEHFVNEREKRARETLAPIPKAKRLVKEDKPLREDYLGNLHLF